MAEKLKKLTCLHCGGEIELSLDGKTATCTYCNAVFQIDTSLSEKSEIDFSQANEYWRTFRFSDAKRKYLSVANENPNFKEAYWGAFISEYGIEWGENRFGDIVPTCHRAHTVSVYDDPNFKKAVELSDNDVYQELGDKIEEIRKEIIEKSVVESPYDVFICFKATEEVDGRNRKTDDYELGREIYNELTDKGYKVFFSPETLMRVQEQEFEPYIFKALSTAKVMLLLCSSEEKIESPWVKNEWGRFLDMNNSKGLIPVCGNKYSPYNPSILPFELRKLNAIEYGPRLFTQIEDKLMPFFPERKVKKEDELAEKEKELNRREKELAEKEKLAQKKRIEELEDELNSEKAKKSDTVFDFGALKDKIKSKFQSSTENKQEKVKKQYEYKEYDEDKEWKKVRYIAAFLSIFFGWIGLCNFYLERYFLGILDIIFMPISWFIGIVRGLKMLAMTNERYKDEYPHHW